MDFAFLVPIYFFSFRVSAPMAVAWALPTRRYHATSCGELGVVRRRAGVARNGRRGLLARGEGAAGVGGVTRVAVGVDVVCSLGFTAAFVRLGRHSGRGVWRKGFPETALRSRLEYEDLT